MLFQEQVEWTVEEKEEYIIGETHNDSGEACIGDNKTMWKW